MALQAAAVLELRQLPATSGPPCSGSACTAWQLLPAGAGLGLAERDVEAAVQAAEAAGAAAEVAAVGEELVAAVVAAAGQAAARMPVSAQAGGAHESSASGSPGTPGARQQGSTSPQAATSSPPAAAAAFPLPLPPSLAVRWLKGPRSPTSVALPFIRPGAAAMLRALLVSAAALGHAVACRLVVLWVRERRWPLERNPALH